jgi:hypothetical protein
LEGKEHADAAPDVRRVAERDEWGDKEADGRARRCAVYESQRDERAGTAGVRPEEGQDACEEGCGHDDIERAWRAVQVYTRDGELTK